MTTDNLLFRAKALKLYGVVARWEEVQEATWIKELIKWEEDERAHRGLEHRLHHARLGRFKALADFDWSWPKKCDREIIEELMHLSFIKEAANIILCGPNGVGKSTIARNIAYQAVTHGHSVLFTTAGQMLNELAAKDGTIGRRLKHYIKPQVLVIDEMGYLSYSHRHADLMFEIVAQRYEKKPTIITTNKPFAEWGEIFPNATSVVGLIDRLVHNAEIISIEAESYRLKEAKEQTLKRKEARSKGKTKVNKAVKIS